MPPPRPLHAPPPRRLSKAPAPPAPHEPDGLGHALTHGFLADTRRAWRAARQLLEQLCIENPVADFIGWLVAVWKGHGLLPPPPPTPPDPASLEADTLAARLKQRFLARQQRRDARRLTQEQERDARRAKAATIREQSWLALATPPPPDDAPPPAPLLAAADASAAAPPAAPLPPPPELTDPPPPPNPPADDDTPYRCPPLTLLLPDDGLISTATHEEIARRRELIQQTLDDFAIDAEVTDAIPGPRITLFQVVPAPGIKVEAIAGIEKNLAMELAAESLRILAPVPGQPYVGIEVPNATAAMVLLRGLLEDANWRDPRALLPVPIGRDIRGRNRYLDLARAPHLLVAGATGSGKSVCVNAMLLALLFRFPPAELQLLLVDPKVVEFAVYRELPHLVCPVINDPNQVPLALQWAIGEMERRYQLLAAAGARNLEGFNQRVPKPGEQDAEGNPLPARLPLLVLVIDELADIMMVAGQEVEKGLARIAQKSRAVGIHAIIATQRPSVDVLTGVIKANFPTRIAFQVASVTDSRVILDSKGAESLLGRGDLLFKPPAGGRLERVQAPLVSDLEIEQVVADACRQRQPRFLAEVLTPRPQELPGLDSQTTAAGATGEEDEELLRQAIELLRSDRRATTSYVQRRLRIGYNRAALVMETLEKRGIVGPQIGTTPREILLPDEPDPGAADP